VCPGIVGSVGKRFWKFLSEGRESRHLNKLLECFVQHVKEQDARGFGEPVKVATSLKKMGDARRFSRRGLEGLPSCTGFQIAGWLEFSPPQNLGMG